MKATLFGISKSKDNETINIFFKSPKRYIYLLMFMLEEEWGHEAEAVSQKSKHWPFQFKFVKKEHRKYKIRFFKLKKEDFNSEDFNIFNEQYLNKYKNNYLQVVELYEFFFSDLYEKIKNENNVYFLTLSGPSKELYKILKKGAI